MNWRGEHRVLGGGAEYGGGAECHRGLPGRVMHISQIQKLYSNETTLKHMTAEG